MNINDWGNRDECKRNALAGPVHEVRMHTIRDGGGVLYEVLIMVSAGPGDVEEHDCWREVWRRYVEFGKDAAHAAGGHAFRLAALDQQFIADEVCRWIVMEP